MNELALFVKPWQALPLPQLAKHVRKLGFDLIELPVRPGFQVEPGNIETELPAAVKLLADEGVRILNITAALPLDEERLYSACAAAGVGMNRVMFQQGNRDYWSAEADARRQLDAALPYCERYGVQIGVQNHSRRFVPVNEMGAYHLLQDYDPRYAAAVWDPAHNALEGMDSDAALDILAPQLMRGQLEEWLLAAHQRTRSRGRRMADLLDIGRAGTRLLVAGYLEVGSDRLSRADLLFSRIQRRRAGRRIDRA